MIAPPRPALRRLAARPRSFGSGLTASWAGRDLRPLAAETGSVSAALSIVTEHYLDRPEAAFELIASAAGRFPASTSATLLASVHLPERLQQHLAGGVMLALAAGAPLPCLPSGEAFRARVSPDTTPALALLFARLLPPHSFSTLFALAPGEGGLRPGEGAGLAALLSAPTAGSGHAGALDVLVGMLVGWARSRHVRPADPAVQVEAAAFCSVLADAGDPALSTRVCSETTPEVIAGLTSSLRNPVFDPGGEGVGLEVALARLHLAAVPCGSPRCALGLSGAENPVVEVFRTLAAEHPAECRTEALDLLVAAHRVICPTV